MIASTAQRLKIMMVTNNYVPYSGGVVSSINSFCEQLILLGHDVHIVTLDFPAECIAAYGSLYKIKGLIRFWYQEKPVVVPLTAYRQLLRYVLHVQPDILHSHHPCLLGTAAQTIAHECQIPIVFTYHTLYEHYLSQYVRLPRWLVEACINKTVGSYCHAVDGVIFPTSIVQRNISTHYQLSESRSSVIPSGLQTIFVHQNYPRKVQEKKNGAFRLLYVGRFAAEKNIPVLLRVFVTVVKQVSHATLTFVGYGPEYQTLRTYAYETLGLSAAQVIFVHQPEKSVIRQHYMTADIFVFSSFTDTQGLVLVEAMAGGMPVVALPGPGQEALLRDGYNGFLVESEEAMVDTLVKLAGDRTLLEQLSYNAWQTSLDYHPRLVTEKLINFYARFTTE